MLFFALTFKDAIEMCVKGAKTAEDALGLSAFEERLKAIKTKQTSLDAPAAGQQFTSGCRPAGRCQPFNMT